jgi:hypothetical protein
VLGMLREIDSREILEGTNGHDEVLALEGELGEAKNAIDAIATELDTHGESSRLYARLRAKETRETELLELLAAARRKAANPLSTNWGEVQSLAKVVQRARKHGDNDTLLRLWTALRSVIETILLLVVPVAGKRVRLAAVQIWFVGGKHRDYLILHKEGIGGSAGSRPAQRRCDSIASVADTDDLDLRRREDAEALAGVLVEMDLQGFATEERRF